MSGENTVQHSEEIDHENDRLFTFNDETVKTKPPQKKKTLTKRKNDTTSSSSLSETEFFSVICMQPMPSKMTAMCFIYFIYSSFFKSLLQLYAYELINFVLFRPIKH